MDLKRGPALSRSTGIRQGLFVSFQIRPAGRHVRPAGHIQGNFPARVCEPLCGECAGGGAETFSLPLWLRGAVKAHGRSAGQNVPPLALSRFSLRDAKRPCENRSAAPDSPRCFVRRTRSARQPRLIPIRRATVSRSQLSGMLRLLPAMSSRRFSTTRPLTMATVTP